jgi:serine/threonine-protein kinase
VAVWHRVLEAFAQRFGRSTILETWSAAVDGENMGVWARVLRGVVDPEGALSQLDALGGDELKTSRWETLSSSPGKWHGRLLVLHDPAYERDGLCALARAAELIAIPALFGLPPGNVTVVPPSSPTARTSHVVQEYQLSWRTFRATSSVAVGAAAGVAGALGSWPAVGEAVAVTAGVASALVGGLAMAVGQLARQRRADSIAQLNRIRALERSMTLKEAREREAIGFFEGAVIAGKYRLGPRLGAGASGVIHRAIRLADEAPVAIKLLRAAVAHDSVASDRLRREADALGLTWHPNVVEVYDHDYLPDGTGYLVMEHLDGESLAKHLKRVGRPPASELVSIALQICDALGAVHAAGVIHRDVKPSNIFLVSGGEYAPPNAPQVKLLDFGIAHVEWAETRLTNMGAPLGTPGYMSPEQEQGDDVDGRSDLFALGAVLYECLTGAPPETRVSAHYNVADRHPASKEDPTFEELNIPDDWKRVIGRAMAPLRSDRYRDARAMRDAIAQLNGTPAASEPAPPASSRVSTA